MDEDTLVPCRSCGKDLFGPEIPDGYGLTTSSFTMDWKLLRKVTASCPHCGADVGDQITGVLNGYGRFLHEAYSYPETMLPQIRELMHGISQILTHSSSNPHRITQLRYGFQTGQRQTLKGINQSHGGGLTRIRRNLQKALRLMRHPTGRRPLKAHLPPSQWATIHMLWEGETEDPPEAMDELLQTLRDLGN